VLVLGDDINCLQKMLETNYSYGIERDEAQLKRNDADPRKWTNPLEVRSVNSLLMWHVYRISSVLLDYRMHRR
jgi:phospholipid:diacylglycerol acyltransferase